MTFVFCNLWDIYPLYFISRAIIIVDVISSESIEPVRIALVEKTSLYISE